MGGLVYDSGALVAAAHGDALMWALHRGALDRDEAPLVLAPALAAAWPAAWPVGDGPGKPHGDADLLAALLRGCAVVDFPVAAARDVGRLLALSGTSDVVPAAVVLAALATRSAVVTADPGTLRGLAAALGARLALATVPLRPASTG